MSIKSAFGLNIDGAMIWRYTPFIIPLIISGAISIAIAIFAWRRRTIPGALPLAALSAAVAIWSFGYALELGSADLATSILGAKIEYLGTVAAPVGWLVFALRYTHHDRRLNRRNLALLAIVPVITLLLVWTNERHGLIWSATSLSTSSAGSPLTVAHGGWFWVHTSYSYLCLLGGVVLLIGALLRAPHLYRRQAGGVLIGVTAPWIGNVLYLFGLNPWPGLDLTPFCFTVTSSVLAWSLLRFRLLDVVPVARDMLVERMSDGVVVVDAHSRVVDLNAAARRALNLPAAEVVGRDAEQVFARWPNLLARYRDATEVAEALEIGAGAGRRVMDVRLSALYDRRGQLTGRMIVWRDITARAELEAALHTSEEKLRVLFDILPVGVAIVDEQRAIVEANPALTRILELMPDDLARSMHTRFHYIGPAGAPLADDDMPSAQALAAGRVVQDAEIGVVTQQGRTIWTNVSAAPIPIAGLGAVVVTTNITDRVRMETELRNANETLQARLDELSTLNRITQTVVAQTDLPAILMTVAQQMTDLLDASGTLIVLLGDSGAELTFAADYDRDPAARNFVGTTFDLSAVPFAAYMIAARQSLLITQPQINELLKLFDPSPRFERYECLLLVPLIMRGTVHGAIIVTCDQHERSFVASEIRLAETVAGQIAGVIEHAKLLDVAERARTAAEGASHAKSQFLGAVSHELRTPLNAILGYAQLLQYDADLAPQHQEALQIIRQSGDHLLTLITDLLDMAKIEAGRLELAEEPIDLAAFLDGIAAMARLWAQHKALDFRFVVSSDAAESGLPASVRADPRRLRQVLLNLLGNAVKFTDTGGVTLSIGLAPPGEYPEGRRIRFQIEDTGIGIPAADIGTIFAPFQQAGDPARRAEGAGLGLAICVELLRLMGGELRVRSEPGAGSCFWFDLALQEVAGVEPAPVAPQQARRIDGAGLAALIVDDDRESRALLRNLLAPLGFVLLEAADGRAGLALALERRPDVLIVDVMMPGLNGIELTRAVRRSTQLIATVIITISASASDDQRRQCLDAGSDAFIAKPIAIEKLLDTLQQLLGATRASGRASNGTDEPDGAAQPLVPPPAEELAALIDLALVGDVRAITQRTEALAQRQAEFEPFARTIQRLTKTFQIDAIQKLLETYQSTTGEAAGAQTDAGIAQHNHPDRR